MNRSRGDGQRFAIDDGGKERAVFGELGIVRKQDLRRVGLGVGVDDQGALATMRQTCGEGNTGGGFPRPTFLRGYGYDHFPPDQPRQRPGMG